MANKKTLYKVQIDPEFEALIDPLTVDEYKQLKDNIREYGLQQKILVWRVPGTDIDLIVDGHNRYRVLKELSEEGTAHDADDNCFSSSGCNFTDRDEAKEWIIKNQLGRRNLTREQKLRLIGKMQESRKQSRGGNRGNQYTAEPKGQDKPLPKTTAQAVAEEYGVSESTVKRAEKYSRGIDALESVSKEAAKKVLKGKSGVTDAQIIEFPKMDSETQKDFAKAVEIGETPEKKKHPYIEALEHPKQEPRPDTTQKKFVIIEQSPSHDEHTFRLVTKNEHETKKPLTWKNPNYQEENDNSEPYTESFISSVPKENRQQFNEIAEVHMQRLCMASNFIKMKEQSSDPEMLKTLSHYVADAMWYFHKIYGVPLGNVEIFRTDEGLSEAVLNGME